MNRHQPQRYLADDHRAIATVGGIEWEELPSLADIVVADQNRRRAEASLWITTSPWENTMPAALDPLKESEPFRETMRGLEMREVREPDVFRHFFGPRR